MVKLTKLKSIKLIPPIVIIGGISCLIFYVLNVYKYSIHPMIYFIVGLCCISIFVLIKLLSLNLKKNNNLKFIGIIFVGIAVGFFSVLNLLVYEAKIITLADVSKITKITAELVSEPKPAGKYYKIAAKLNSCEYNSGEKFSSYGNVNLFFPKDVIDQNLSGGISKIKSTGNNDCRIFVRGVILTTYGRFSVNEKYKGVQAFFTKPVLPKFNKWKSPFASFRGHLRFNLMRLLYSWGSAGALLLALLSADRSFLSENIKLAFINSGLVHVLALSGMHVSIISSSSSNASKFFLGKKVAIRISLIAILFFIWFAGSAPSLNRAIGMAIILIFGRTLGLRPKNISVMCLMLVIHFLVKPAEALTLGFMLSYSALAGILLFGEAITTIVEGKFPKSIISSFAASIGAQSFTAPIITFFIGRIAVIGLIASSIISPMIAFYLIVGILFVFLSMAFPFIAFWLGKILNSIFNSIFSITKFFALVTPIQPKDFLSSICFALIPIFFGIICMKYASNISIKRLVFARNNL